MRTDEGHRCAECRIYASDEWARRNLWLRVDGAFVCRDRAACLARQRAANAFDEFLASVGVGPLTRRADRPPS